MAAPMAENPEQLLADARAGMPETLGQLLQLYGNYLKLLAAAQLDNQLQVRCSPSDVVQETFLEAHRDFPQFAGQSEVEFLAWLRRILVNNLLRAVEKHVYAERRCVRREVSLDKIEASVERSTARLEAVLADHEVSPSSQVNRHEWAVILADQLAELEPDHREVLVLRHLHSLPFKEVAARMDRSPGAVRMLWMRAIGELRHRLGAKGLV